MASSNPLRALALLALLLAAPLLALAPAAAAQEANVVIVFPDHDTGSALARKTPNILQADQLRIQINSGGSEAWVKAKCKTGCLEQPDREYYARWLGSGDIYFPASFTERGPLNNAEPMSAYGMPRYNGTWEITALVGTSTTRTVNVWLMDFFTSPDWTAQPGATYLLHARGYDGSNVTLRIDHKGPDGRYGAIHGPLALTSFSSQILYRWEVPKSEAARIRSCREVALDCTSYRLVVSGGGKMEDKIPFRMEPSMLTATRIAPNDVLTPQLERTMNLSAEYIFHYPGGTLFQGPPITPNELPASSVTPAGTLRVQVVNTTLNDSYIIDEAPMQFVPGIRKWVVTWTAPKDLAMGPGGSSSYQLVLPETRDNWGNRIPRTILSNYTITRATLTPTLTEGIHELPRTEEGRFGIQIKYHNGTPWTDSDNQSAIRGCFVRADETAICRDETRVSGEYEGDGTWVFKVRFPRTHEALTDYRFILPDETRDRWGNRVERYESATFRVVAGSPRIDFRTVTQGEATDTLARGHRVAVTAIVTYGDGEPYNNTVAPNGTHLLNATLIKRAHTGEVVDEHTFSLSQTDRESGRYFATLDLTRDEATTPVGRWSFRFDVLDNAQPPNRNLTAFDREIVGAPILIQPREHPVSVIPTSGTAKFRFELRYEDGTEVPESSLSQRIEARVHPHDGTAPTGDPISGRLVPKYELGAWTVQFTVPDDLYKGRYAFVVTGEDRFGNPIETRAVSRPWTTFAETRARGVLTQPAHEVARGESAVVVFDGDAGDMGAAATGVPSIRVERHDTTRGAWVVEALDVRQGHLEGNDHVGVFEVFETTPIGTYRFTLVGRDAQYRPIESASKNFTVLPTDLTRAITSTPPRQIVKGELFSFQVERRQGDQLRETSILYNGRPATLQPPVLNHIGGFTNVTWQVPFEAPAGNYTLILRGLDVYGNRIAVRSPAIDALPAQLEGQLLGSPPRVVERGESVNVLFGIRYPSGLFYLAPNAPEAVVHNASGIVGRADVVRQGATFQVSWTPPAEVGFDDYWFEISGRGASGNIFPTLRSESFRLSAGAFARNLATDVQPAYTRGDTITFAVAISAQDAFVGFELDYLGPVSGSATDLASRPALTTSSIPHDIDAATGRYVVNLPTDKATPVGAYRFRMTGEDQQSNEIGARSSTFLLRTMPIVVRWQSTPQIDALTEATRLEWTFTLEYTDGTFMTDAMGRPNTAILIGTSPLSNRPELTYENDVWRIVWTTPDTLLDGRYTIVVGGGDNNGNGIQNSQTAAYPFTSDLQESFSKTVPGASPALALLGLAALALATSRRARRP